METTIVLTAIAAITAYFATLIGRNEFIPKAERSPSDTPLPYLRVFYAVPALLLLYLANMHGYEPVPTALLIAFFSVLFFLLGWNIAPNQSVKEIPRT